MAATLCALAYLKYFRIKSFVCQENKVKILSFLVMLLMAFSVNAGNNLGMNQQQMQAMMQKAQEMQTCMQNVDESEMQAFQQRAEKMGAEVKALCAAGKRTEAQNKMMAFAKELNNDDTMQTLKKCGEIMQGMMPEFAGITQTQESENSKSHICDQ